LTQEGADGGTFNFLFEEEPERIKRVFAGETVFIPPLRHTAQQSHPGEPGELTKAPPAIFFVAPIRRQAGTVIAALIQSISPNQNFSRILQTGRLGLTGESYAFNRKGALLSPCRFEEQIQRYGLIGKGESAILNMIIRDPGGNLAEGYTPDKPFSELPLTHMAESAIKGHSGSNMVGYRDYRGEMVIGVWQWNDILDIGLSTEIDLSEAIGPYHTLRLTVFGIVGVILLLSLIAVLFTLSLGERATQALARVRDDLEIEVKERTKELQNREARLQDAYEIISSSIRYASRIQKSILPEAKMIASTLNDHFVLWEPRDRVGGDIYFFKPWGLGKFIALVDCTGHGVPGAFVTMIANGALDMATLETPPGDSAILLQRTHQLIQTALGQQHKVSQSDDGLEMGLCYIAPRNTKMVFAGARFSLFIVENGEVSELKGDKKYGIGYRATPNNVQFANYDVKIDSQRTFYMTSDGLIDQIGGPKRRSFGKKRFKRLLLEMETIPVDQRADYIRQALTDYQGLERRRDDVSVVGFSFAPRTDA
ncbi:SpoIIE family protein phosphatase, partial [Thermodesulfobacteriota bacterium]